MKQIYTLFSMAFAELFPPLCAIMAAMAVIEGFIFALIMDGIRDGVSYAHLIDNSGVPPVFALAFIAVLVLVALRFPQRFRPSKSIYALLTLPIKRRRIYQIQLGSALLAVFCLVAVQLLLLLLGLSWYQSLYTDRSANLYMALLDSYFLRMLFPPEPLALTVTLFVIVGAVCLTLAASALIRAGAIWRTLLTASLWLIFVFATLPLHARVGSYAIVKIFALLVLPILMSVMGMRTFKTGAVTK